MICSQYPTRHVIRHVSKWYEAYPVHASGRMSRDVVTQKEAVRAGSEHVRVRAVQSLISFIIMMESEVVSGMCGSVVYSLLETSGTKERESASLTGRNSLGIPVTPRLINAVPPSEQLEEQPLLTCVYVNVSCSTVPPLSYKAMSSSHLLSLQGGVAGASDRGGEDEGEAGDWAPTVPSFLCLLSERGSLSASRRNNRRGDKTRTSPL